MDYCDFVIWIGKKLLNPVSAGGVKNQESIYNPGYKPRKIDPTELM
jgi:hypothetical protein